MTDYDSTADTLAHIRRVDELLAQVARALLDRVGRHDLSKLEPPEKPTFDVHTPGLRETTYGSSEYAQHLREMGDGLAHHYAHNRHHPEHFGERGIAGMTLVDLVEMLVDWKAATERHDDGDLARSLLVQEGRFGIEPQLAAILANTAVEFGWLADVAEPNPAGV